LIAKQLAIKHDEQPDITNNFCCRNAWVSTTFGHWTWPNAI